ncbi:MAG: low molecular weight phosphotyrosine protein phosphatase [Gammaproteobacteria bacterium]|nr:low molecular weight phosphotyrosine protein phosphatase [Gammaproteobacteria bacterium]
MAVSEKKVKVLFVCMGNIYRSPSGEGVFQHHVETAGYSERIVVDSAGTIGYHTGNPADSRMQAAAIKRGYSLDSLARQVNVQDFHEFDLIIAMDVENLENLDHLAGERLAHVRMLGSFLKGIEDPVRGPSVPDPYYGGEAGFEQVLDMIEEACPAILAHCQALLKQN